jgi:hypothetical protein
MRRMAYGRSGGSRWASGAAILLGACQLVGGISDRRVEGESDDAGGGTGAGGAAGKVGAAGLIDGATDGATGGASEASNDAGAAGQDAAGGSGAVSNAGAVYSYRFGDKATQRTHGLAITRDPGEYVVLGEFRGEVDFGELTPILRADLAGDVFLAKWSPEGRVIWAKHVLTPAQLGSFGAIDLHGTGRTVWAGHAPETMSVDGAPLGGGNGVFLLTLENDGKVNLTRSYLTSIYASALDVAIGVDSILMTGEYSGDLEFGGTAPRISSFPDDGPDGFVAKVDALGNGIWARTYECVSRAIRPLPDGGAIVLGSASQSCDFNGRPVNVDGGATPCFVARLTADGATSWLTQFPDAGTCEAGDLSVAVDESIAAAGHFTGSAALFGLASSNQADAFVVKLDPQGNPVWGRLLERPGFDVLTSVTLDEPRGSLILSGYFESGLIAARLEWLDGRLSATWETFQPTPFDKPGIFSGLDLASGIVVAGSLLRRVDLGAGLLEPAGDLVASDVFIAGFSQ